MSLLLCLCSLQSRRDWYCVVSPVSYSCRRVPTLWQTVHIFIIGLGSKVSGYWIYYTKIWGEIFDFFYVLVILFLRGVRFVWGLLPNYCSTNIVIDFYRLCFTGFINWTWIYVSLFTCFDFGLLFMNRILFWKYYNVLC